MGVHDALLAAERLIAAAAEGNSPWNVGTVRREAQWGKKERGAARETGMLWDSAPSVGLVTPWKPPGGTECCWMEGMSNQLRV